MAINVFDSDNEFYETKETKFLRLLDKSIIKYNQDNKREASTSIKPSQLYKCPTAQYYDILHYPTTGAFTAKTLRVFGIGTVSHEYIQETVLKNFEDIRVFKKEDVPNYGVEGLTFIDLPDSIEIKYKDYRFTNKFPISAAADGVFEWEGENYILEFKTVKSSVFASLCDPVETHLLQGKAYALSLGIMKVLFLYMNKDTQELKAFIHTYTYEDMKWIAANIRTLETTILLGNLKEYVPMDECKWCSYKSACKSGVTHESIEFTEDGRLNVKWKPTKKRGRLK